MTRRNSFLTMTAFVGALTFTDTLWAEDIIPPKQYTVTPGGVGLADGSFTFTDTDLTIGTLSLERFHLGGRRDPNDPFFGPRMSHNFDIYITVNRRTDCSGGPATCTTYNKPVVHMGLSASGTFYESLPPNPVIFHQNDDSYSGDLERNGAGAYVYTDQAGSIFTFSTTVAASGAGLSYRVDNIVLGDGRRQNFLYNGSGQLKAVTDTSGYAIVFDYGANGNVSFACAYNLADTYVSVSSTCGTAGLKASYGYSAGSPAKLTSVTDVLGNVTSYSYDRNEISCVTPSGYIGCKIANTYGSASYAWQVTQQSLAGGAPWVFQYAGNYLKARDPEVWVEVEPWTQVTLTNPAGQVSYHSFVASSPYAMTDPYSRVTSYKFGGGADYSTEFGYSTRFGASLEEVVLPEGNSYTATYGLRRAISSQTLHAKPGSGLSDLATYFGYVASCNSPNTRQNCAKPIWKRDAKNNQTDYTYMTNGLLLTEMQPAPSAGAARPLKVNTYTQRYAYIRNSGGALVAASSPTWVKATESECQTVAGSSPAAVCDGAAPQKVTTYEYGASGTGQSLLVKGVVVTADSASLRTCYGYDQRGNRISETTPRAGLASCP